jgi:hypothetical protein
MSGTRSVHDWRGESRESWRSQYLVNSSANRKSIKVRDIFENERTKYCSMSVFIVLEYLVLVRFRKSLVFIMLSLASWHHHR